MGKIESGIVGLCIALACPALLFFASCLIGFTLLPLESRVITVTALTALALGALLDLVFLRRWIRRAYNVHPGFPVFVYLSFSVVAFALCMGVPVGNVLLGVVAGVYGGRRLRHAEVDVDRARRAARRVGTLTTAVIFVICCLSATIALISASTPSDLQGMLQAVTSLQLTVTWPMVVGLILFGGSALILLQYWLTRTAALLAYRLGRPTPQSEI